MTKNYLVLLMVWVISPHFVWADIEAAKNAGSSVGGQIRSTWGKPENLANDVTKPVMTGEVPLETLDGSVAENVSITCPGTQELFQILVQPGATKDLNFILVTYNRDFSGPMDSSVNISGPISGVCANGFVSCDPGTWNNCHWFEWQFDGNLQSNEVAPNILGGCFCINSGCTPASVMAMKQQILNTLAGGVAGAMAAFNPRFAAAKAQIDGFLITYFGQNAGGCNVANVQISGSYPTPEDVFKNPSALETIAQGEVATQSSNSDSIYSKLTSSPAFTNQALQTCTMTRDAYFDSSTCSIQEPTTNGCQALAGNPDCQLQKEIVYDLDGNPVTTYENHGPTGITPIPSCKNFDSSSLGSTDVNQCIALGKVQTDGGCNINYPCTGVVYSPSDNLFQCSLPETGQNSCGVIFDYQICGKVIVAWDIPDDPCELITIDGNTVKDYCPSVSQSTTPDSGSIEFDSGSNQVALHASFNNRRQCNEGLAAGTVTVYLTPLIPKKICHEWWRVERTYTCRDNATYHPDISRTNTITPQESQSGWLYTDMGQTLSVDFQMQSPEACVKACKIAKRNNTARADAAKTSNDYRHDPTNKLIIYKNCVNNTCPVGPGETVITDCQCLNEFNMAAGVMEILKQGAADQVCSTR